MSASIESNADKLIKKLDLIQKAYLPQAAEQALKSFGLESRKTLADAMREKYQTATNYTLSSARYKVEGQTLTISILDDPRQNQSAAEYLFPTDRSDGRRQKPIKPTTLVGFLQGKYGPTESRFRCLALGQAASSSTSRATSRARRFRA